MRGEKTILIVDDEEHLQSNMVAYLEDEGYTVITAADGESGIERLEKNAIDLGIIDMRLPGMDGNSFIIKAHQIRPDMKFIVHTGSMTYSIPQSLTDIGIGKEQVFLKPVIDMSTMMNAIRQLIGAD